MRDIFYMPYLFKVWTTTILVAPVAYYLYLMIGELENWRGSFPILFLMLLFGTAFSAPTFILLILLFKVMERFGKSLRLIKLLLSVVGLSGVIISFHVAYMLRPYAGPIIYSLILIGSILYFSPEKRDDRDFI